MQSRGKFFLDHYYCDCTYCLKRRSLKLIMHRWVFGALMASWCIYAVVVAHDECLLPPETENRRPESHQDAHTSALIYLPTNVKPIETIFIRSLGGVSVRLLES